MADAEVLFSPARGFGVIPLSGHTLFINRDLDYGGAPQKTYKGRLYISAAASTHEKRRQLVEQTAEILRSLSFTIYK